MQTLFERKKALVIGTGKWGKVMIDVLIKKNFLVIYANKNLNKDYDLESKYSEDLIKGFTKVRDNTFDIAIFCLRPEHIFSAWMQFRVFAKNIIIEKPGPLNPKELENIIKWCNEKDKKLLFNYEFFYTESSIYLRNLIKNKIDEISHVEIFWFKKLINKGNLNWRLLPHLISEIYYGCENLEIKVFKESKEKISAEGYLGKLSFKLLISNADERNHSLNLYMKNGIKYFKDEKFLYLNEKKIIENKRSSLEFVVDLFKEEDKKLFTSNNKMALFILKTIVSLNS